MRTHAYGMVEGKVWRCWLSLEVEDWQFHLMLPAGSFWGLHCYVLSAAIPGDLLALAGIYVGSGDKVYCLCLHSKGFTP